MGHFKIDRAIIDHAVFAHPIALKIWVWCLAKASWKNRSIPLKIGKGEIIVDLKPGQFIFGRFKAEESLNIDGSAIYRWIQKFASDGWELIELKSNNQYTLITICNWAKYQTINEEDEQPMSSQRTTDEQPMNTNKKVYKVKKDINIAFEDFWKLYPNKIGRSKCESKWANLTNEERESIIKTLPTFISYKPFESYNHPNPETYINQKRWQDEIPTNNGSTKIADYEFGKKVKRY